MTEAEIIFITINTILGRSLIVTLSEISLAYVNQQTHG